ncbi:MAG: 50S ribosomal protein L28 [Clostridiales bacterium]|nr:50S ribosomal protein L28 [Clostridiales bacterium]MCF8022567.1 50S ribosomal protein L28 [Clostridiales bacterium]
MAKKCAICGKGVQTGMQYSHSHIRTKRKWNPNLQKVKAIINGTPKRILVCTRCLRSGKVKRSI